MRYSTIKTSVDDLTERISVIYHETERNTRGDIVNTAEVTRYMVWAKVLPLSGKIQDETPARENTVTYRVTIRFRQDIKTDDEIIWRGKRLKITAPPYDVESQKIWLQFDAREVVQDGKFQ